MISRKCLVSKNILRGFIEQGRYTVVVRQNPGDKTRTGIHRKVCFFGHHARSKVPAQYLQQSRQSCAKTLLVLHVHLRLLYLQSQHRLFDYLSTFAYARKPKDRRPRGCLKAHASFGQHLKVVTLQLNSSQRMDLTEPAQNLRETFENSWHFKRRGSKVVVGHSTYFGRQTPARCPACRAQSRSPRTVGRRCRQSRSRCRGHRRGRRSRTH